jgi:hypothetical protein
LVAAAFLMILLQNKQNAAVIRRVSLETQEMGK